MKKSYVLFCLGFIFLLSACSEKKEGDIDARIYSLETEFKENYQLWVDMKSDGSIQQKEYALDIKSVGNKFKSIGNKAKTSTYKKMLSEQDQSIYETYRLLGSDIYDMGYALYYGKKDTAQERYTEILEVETNIKE